MSSDRALIDDFVAESLELLEGMDRALDEVFHSGDRDGLNSVFRAVHTVKGTAGFLGFLNVKNYCHIVEDVLDRLRSNNLPLDGNLQRQLIICLDLLTRQVPRVAREEPSPTLLEDEERSLEQLKRVVEEIKTPVADPEAVLRSIAKHIAQYGETDEGEWLSRLDSMVKPWKEEEKVPAGLDLSLPWFEKRAVQSFHAHDGTDLTAEVHALLPFFKKAMAGITDNETTEAFLAAAEKLAELLTTHQLPDAAAKMSKVATDCRVIHESPIDLDDLLISTFVEPIEESIEKLRVAALVTEAAPAPPKEAKPKPARAATKSEARAEQREPDRSPPPNQQQATVRVREEALDRFIWSVGEIFLALELYRDLQHRISELPGLGHLGSEFNEINRELGVSVGKLQQSVMDVRRVPAGTLLNKIPSKVRQLAEQLGKEVEAVVEGSELLVDKSLLQELEGPMTHLIRNALDHGLQTPQERFDMGLDPAGKLIVECRIDRQTVIFEVRDNGRGIDSDRVLRTALERGVTTRTEASLLSEDEIRMLLCRPGFSTAKTISDVSGRGVGLDVVLSAVERNRGKLRIDSQVGAGTSFNLTFPLRSTVLMVDGLVCAVDGRFAAFPSDYINEVVRIEPGMISTVTGNPIATVRNRTYPVRSLRELVGLKSEKTLNKVTDGLILSHQHRSMFLCVDELRGYRRMVLKDFDRSLIECRILSGVAQLGGSKLALVFDVPELLRNFC